MDEVTQYLIEEAGFDALELFEASLMEAATEERSRESAIAKSRERLEEMKRRRG